MSTSTTTFVVQTATGYVTRTSATMAYTHAVLVTNPKSGQHVTSWHLTEAAAKKAAASWQANSDKSVSCKAVPVHAHKGGKAAVLRMLAANEADVAAVLPTPAKKVAAAKAPAKEVTKKAAAPAPAKAAAPAPERRVTLSGVPHPADSWARILTESGLSVAEMERKMEVPVGALYRITKRGGVPSAALTVRFAEATGTNLNALWLNITGYELAEAQAEAKKAVTPAAGRKAGDREDVTLVSSTPAKKAPAKAAAKKAPAKAAAKKAPAKAAAKKAAAKK